MTDTMPTRRTYLPLAAGSATGTYQTCRWKCHYDCWHAPRNTSDNETFAEVVARGIDRRGFLRGMLVVTAAAGVSTLGAPSAGARERGTGAAVAARHGGSGALTFTPIEPTGVDELVIPDGYRWDIIARWGDPIFRGGPEFDYEAQTGETQAQQFGYNNDFVAFMPLPRQRGGRGHHGGRGASQRGLLWVNHEYVNPQIMFPDWDEAAVTLDQADVIINAVGGSVLTLERRRGPLYSMRVGGRHNRRITLETPMRITGPAAGHPLLQTSEDPSGRRVRGMVGNCAGGRTPWGTILTGEENIQFWFANSAEVDYASLPAGDFVKDLTERFGIEEGATDQGLEQHYDRFDMAKEPFENHRFGWVVEIDPYRPRSVPRKRTALGRLKHEGAATSLTADGRVTAYMGDDEAFEYVYKFVTDGRYDPRDRRANRDLLDEGTLYVARFDVDDEGNRVGEWLPLIAGEGPLTAEAGFPTQAEVCVGTRFAADLLGATKMDRPEDVQRNPVTGAVYIALTKNADRGAIDDNGTPRNPNDDIFYPQEDPANPRAVNNGGHVIELVEDGDDAGATTFTWSLFLVCGDPDDPSTYFAGFPADKVSPIACPDNFAFDNAGNVIVATDGAPGVLGVNDAFHFVPTEGDERGHVKQFLSVPVDAEACGPELTPDNRTLFCAVQHPGEDGTATAPTSTWPDGTVPPRPAVVDIAKRGRGVVGT